MSSVRQVSVGLVLTISGVLVFGTSLAQAQTERAANRIRGFNNEVLRLHAEIEQAAPTTAAELRRQGAAAIARRAAEMSALIEKDPAQALSMAFPADLAVDLAGKFPEAAGQLETQGTWQGPADYRIEDYPNGSSRTIVNLKSGAQNLEVHFAGPVPGLKCGDSLEVTGVRVGNAVAASGATVQPMAAMATTSTTSVTCSTTGVQNTAVLLVTFPSVTLPSTVTTQAINDAFFGTSTGHSVDGFLREASYGQTSATGNAFGPYTLTGSYSSCSDVGGAVLNDAIAAATASGVNLNNYSRVFLAFPDIFGCGWAGFAASGCSITTSSGTFNASTGYMVTAYITSRDAIVALASHEIGHNFGLLHSGIITTGTNTVLGPVSSPGTEYDQNGDYWSTLGEWVLGLYPAPQKAEVLGWMAPSTNYQVVQSSGKYTLQPLEVNPPALQALKVQRGTGNNEWLWIEYRQPLGNYDSTLSPQPFSGALIHYEDGSTPLGHTYLPNFTPSDTTWNSPALAAGQTWTDPYTNVSLSVLSATSTGLSVSVNYGSVPCTHANPTVSLSPANPSVSAGSSVNYTVSVTNNDSSGCSASTFFTASTQPSGWNGTFSASSLALNPGQTSFVTLAEGVPATAVPGTDSLSASATSLSYTGSGSANCTVTTAPTLTDSLSVSGSTFSARQTVVLTAKVLYGNSAAAGASVSFTMTKANGSTVSGTATTGSTGLATWSYRIGSKDPTGTWSAVSKATYNSQTASSGTATFTVQ